MKFSCEKYLLQAACNVVSRAAASKSPIPALEGLQIVADDRLTIKGYDTDTEMYTLSIPNQEVRVGYVRGLLPALKGMN